MDKPSGVNKQFLLTLKSLWGKQKKKTKQNNKQTKDVLSKVKTVKKYWTKLLSLHLTSIRAALLFFIDILVQPSCVMENVI